MTKVQARAYGLVIIGDCKCDRLACLPLVPDGLTDLWRGARFATLNRAD